MPLSEPPIPYNGTATTYLDGTRSFSTPGVSAAGLNAGTSNPGSPSTNDLFFRSDLDMVVQYDGTQWRCVCPHALCYAGSQSIAATGSIFAPTDRTYGMYVTTLDLATFVSTTNNGTSFWSVSFDKLASDNTATSLGTATTSADSANTWVTHPIAVNAVVATTSFAFRQTWTKTSVPGNLTPVACVWFNRVVT